MTTRTGHIERDATESRRPQETTRGYLARLIGAAAAMRILRACSTRRSRTVYSRWGRWR